MSRLYNNPIRKYFGLLSVVVLSLVLISDLNATHIVGSDMSFRCLGNDFYEVKLVIRRDCINGASDAPFDDPASVGIFDSNGNLIDWLGSFGQILIPFSGQRVVDTGRPACGYFGGELCVEEATYVGRVYLPFRSQGYILAYERCCRNVTLNNILSPLETGTSKFVCLNETTLNSCNSSPEFQEWPDVIICSDGPLDFDHIAIDPDGDSLSYKLVTPHSGASLDMPKPQPPVYEPFDTVRWAQGYSVNNLLGAGEPLVVNSATGTISGVPNVVGQFLVGVLVEEWRDGQLLSKVIRDFEYNVRVCDDIARIDFATDPLVCEGLTVTVDNQSIDDFGYTWNFNYPSEDTKFISTERSPSFTYDSPGVYKISLSSTHPSNGCENIIIKEVGVYDSEIEVDFATEVGQCQDGMLDLRLEAIAVDRDPAHSIEIVNWTITSDGIAYKTKGLVSSIKIPCLDEVNITATAISTSGCSNVYTKNVVLKDTSSGTDLIVLAGDTLYICEGESVSLLNSALDGVKYTWTPLDGLTFGDTILYSDPVASPADDTKYTVSATFGTDRDTAMVLVIVDEYPIYEIDKRSFNLCEGAGETVSITSEQNLEYDWYPSEGVDQTDGANPIFTNRKSRTYYVEITNGHCSVTDSVVVNVIPTEISEVEDAIRFTERYDTITRELQVSINAAELIAEFDIVSIRWTLEAEGQLFMGDGSDIQVILPQGSKEIKYTYFFTDSQGCEYMIIRMVDIDSLNVGDDLIDIAGDTLYICEGESVALLNSSVVGLKYTWTPREGLTFGDTIFYNDPVASPADDTKYTVTATNGSASDTAEVVVIVYDLPVYNMVADTVRYCEGNTGSLDFESEENLTFVWTPTEGIDQTNPAHPIFMTRESRYYYVTISNENCSIEDSIYIEVTPTEVSDIELVDFNVDFNDTTRQFNADINANGALDRFDIVSIRWVLMAGDVLLNGDGSAVDATIPSNIRMVKLTYFITDSKGCEYMVMRTIDLSNVDMPPVISFTGQDTIIACIGDSVRLIANPNSNWTYRWMPETGLVFDTEDDKSNPLYVGDSSRMYVVSVSNGSSTVVDSIYVLRTNRMLMLSFPYDQGTICEGTSTQRVINPNHSANTIYEWSFDSDFTTIIATGQEAVLPVDGNSATVYVRAEDPRYCGSNVPSLTLRRDEIDVTASFGDLDFCESNPPTTDVVITNNDTDKDVNIMWDADSRIISGRLDTNVITISPDVRDTVVVLTYRASDGRGCEVVREVRVPVSGNLVSTIQSNGDIGCIGPVNLAVSSQEVNATYEWALSSSFTTIIATGSSVSLNLDDRPATVYVRGAHPDYCVSAIDSILIDAGTLDDLNISVAPLNTCVSNITEVNVTSSNDITVIWDASENITSDPNQLPITVTANDGQEQITLYFTVSTEDGCTQREAVVIDVLSSLSADITVDSASCDGTFGRFAAIVNAVGATYEWSFDPSFSNVISTDSVVMLSLPVGQTLYMRAKAGTCVSNVAEITAADAQFQIRTDAPSIICVGDTVIINAQAGNRDFAVSWGSSNNIINSTDTSITLVGLPGQNTISINYTAQSTDGCSTSGTLALEYSTVRTPEPTVSLECGSYKVYFTTDGFGDADILWDFGVTAGEGDQIVSANPTFDFMNPGEYTVRVSSLQRTCAFDDFSFDVVVPEILDLTTNSDQIIPMCDGGDTTVTVSAMTTSGLPIIWTSESGDILTTGNSLTFTSVDHRVVIATVSDTFGCSEMLTFTISNDPLDPMVEFPNGNDSTVCAGEPFTIKVSDNLRSNLVFDWMPRDVIQGGQGTGEVSVVLNEATTLSVLVTDTIDGCSKELLIDIAVSTVSVQITTDDDDEICLGESVTLTAQSDATIVEYDWSTGESGSMIAVSPAENTTYSVTVTDQNGCMATSEIDISVIPPQCNDSDIFIPTAFSPNGDGQNDILYVRSKFIQSMDWSIVNRWGQEVYTSTDQSEGWNGRMRNTGKELAPDVYAYTIRVNCIDGQEYMMTGQVTLVR